MSQLAWHFIGADRRPHDLCESGLHASERAIDALTYASGPVACLVEAGRESNKLVCLRILAMLDATELLRFFARQCALDVIHLWDAPAVVLEYLETGDETLRAAVEDVARAARDAAWAAGVSWSARATWDVAKPAVRAIWIARAAGAFWATVPTAWATAGADRDARNASGASWASAWATAQVLATSQAVAQATQNQFLESLLLGEMVTQGLEI